MARASGKPAVCFATSGPGATNILTAIADAKLDSIPLVCITGQVPTAMIGTDAFQEVDTYGMSMPVTKHNFLVRSAAELLEVIPEAFRIAASGRPGPVLVDVPKDVQNQVIEFQAWPEPGSPDPAPAGAPADIAEAARLINAAARPILYIGGGVIHAGADPPGRPSGGTGEHSYHHDPYGPGRCAYGSSTGHRHAGDARGALYQPGPGSLRCLDRCWRAFR